MSDEQKQDVIILKVKKMKLTRLPILKEDPTGEAIQKAAEECAEHVLVGQGAKTFARIIEKHFRKATGDE